MKKLISCLLALALLCGFCCLAENFELMGITLATTPEEAEALLGEDVQKRVESYPELGELTVLRKYDIELFGHDSEAITLLFFNGKLATAVINYTDAAVFDAAMLAETISAEYGEGIRYSEYYEIYGEYYYSVDDIFGETSRYAEWQCGEEGVEAALTLDLVEDSEYSCFLTFVNTPVMAAMEEAIMPFVDE